MLKNISDDQFSTEVLQSTEPVLLKISAEWCGPCKQQAPIIDKLAKEFDGKIKFLEIDSDNCPKICSLLKVKGVPALFLFSKGESCGSILGLASEGKVKALLQQVE